MIISHTKPLFTSDQYSYYTISYQGKFLMQTGSLSVVSFNRLKSLTTNRTTPSGRAESSSNSISVFDVSFPPGSAVDVSIGSEIDIRLFYKSPTLGCSKKDPFPTNRENFCYPKTG